MAYNEISNRLTIALECAKEISKGIIFQRLQDNRESKKTDKYTEKGIVSVIICSMYLKDE